MRIVEPHEHQVGTRAYIGRNRSLWSNILPALLIDAYLDACRVAKLLGVGDPLISVAFDEGCPAQKAQFCALFRFVLEFALRKSRSRANHSRSHCTGGGTGRGLQNVTPCNLHCPFLL